MMEQKVKPVSSEVLVQLKNNPYNYPTTRWAVFENHALDSAGLGDRLQLAIGPQNTYKERPGHPPDSSMGMGWKFCFIGWVNLDSGAIEKD